jgi:hypothetical protein
MSKSTGFNWGRGQDSGNLPTPEWWFLEKTVIRRANKNERAGENFLREFRERARI